jgi:2',3'-cyclic-nucleotide 2'-phosphodiesterase (5'-nucleotidase family)
MVGNEPLDRGATYTLAAPEFLLQGGDGYELLTDGEEPVYLGFTDNSIVIDTLKERGTVSPAVEGRIVIR